MNILAYISRFQDLMGPFFKYSNFGVWTYVCVQNMVVVMYICDRLSWIFFRSSLAEMLVFQHNRAADGLGKE